MDFRFLQSDTLHIGIKLAICQADIYDRSMQRSLRFYMDIATLAGIIFGVACTIIPIVTGGVPGAFIDAASIYIVLGGGLASVFISYRLTEVTSILKVVVKAFTSRGNNQIQTIHTINDLASKARKEGLIALESYVEDVNDPFVKQFMQMVIDGMDPDMVKNCMLLELQNMEDRHARGQGLFKTMASLFPAWGMIGTLIGLIALLRSLDDAAKIGPAMSLALVTTFYGSILANFICLPIANKLKIKSQEEIKEREMMIEGILSVQAGENPMIIEQKLKMFLSPEEKLKYEQQSKRLKEDAVPGMQVLDARGS